MYMEFCEFQVYFCYSLFSLYNFTKYLLSFHINLMRTEGIPFSCDFVNFLRNASQFLGILDIEECK